MNEHLLNLCLGIGIVLLVLLGYFHPITALSQDLGRHLFTGNLILESHRVPQTNLFSYTYPDFQYINTHWLSQVAFALVEKAFSFPGLFVLMLLLIGSAFTLQITAVYKKVHSLVLAVAGILYTGILFERTDLRPELFSFLFLSVFITILYHNRDKPTKLLYLLVPLQLLWVNLHIYFAIGLVALGLFFIDMLLVNRKELTSKPVIALGSVLLISVLISLINPNGLSGLLYPLHVFSNYGYSIEENQGLFFLESLGFHKASAPFLKIATVMLFISLIAAGKKAKPIDWLLSLLFTYLAYSAVRNMPLFVFATFIPFTIFTSLLLRKLLSPLPKHFHQYLPWIAGLFFGCLFIWQTLHFSQHTGLGYAVQPGAKGGSEFLKREKLTERMFNNFDIGGYLIYSRYPEQQVFVDNRPEAYPASFFRDVYIPMQENPELFTRVVTDYRINLIFFSYSDQTPWGMTFMKTIVNDPAWSIVYLDDFVIILVRKTPEHEKLIKHYGMTTRNLHITKQENTFEANARIANFLTTVGWKQDAIPYYLEVLKLKPNYCPALGLLAQAYAEDENPAGSIYSQMYTTSCF